MKLKPVMILVTALALVSLPVLSSAYEINSAKLYGGTGLTFNTLGIGNATGLQIFAGYKFDAKINTDISSAVEVGFMNTGNFNNRYFGGSSSAQGVWASLVESVPVTNKIDANIRAGADFGDDDGFLVGAGMGYHIDNRTDFRTDYVVRNNINSFQFNVLFHFQ
jgi:hypothetical protein